MRVSNLVVSLSCFWLLACASAPAPVPSGPPPDWKLASASMETGNTLQGNTGSGGGQVTNTIVGHNINGPVASLYSGPNNVRGNGNSGRTVDVTIRGNAANGLVGGIPFSCRAEFAADGSAHVIGAMGAGNSDFILSPKVINGRIGVVTYNLAWNGTKYEGQMVPGGYGYLELPAVMATWSDMEVVTVLSLILMGA